MIDAAHLIPVGSKVTYPLARRVLLGDVTGYRLTPHGDLYLTVRYFNGEPWPICPRAYAVEVLDL